MTSKIWICAGLLTLGAACNDDGGAGDDDTAIDADLPVDIDAAVEPDAASAADAGGFEPPTVHVAPLSSGTPDQFQAAVAGPGGTFYIAGWIQSGVTSGTRTVFVTRATAQGPDTTFGQGGIFTSALELRGGNGELDLVVQSTGKIVLSAPVASGVQPLDTDVALIRINTDGTLDTTFGSEGKRILDWNTAIISGDPATASGGDRPRGLAIDATDRIYIHGLQRGVGDGRTDTDFVVARLSADGAPDEAFGTGGRFLNDIRGAGDVPSNATPHAITVLADGSVLAAGYASTAGVGTTGPQPVIYKLDSSGDPVTAFATGGTYHQAPLVIQTEVYGFALHGDHIVTGGYGRDEGTQNDWVSLRMNVATGAIDLGWGGTTNGVVIIDPKTVLDPALETKVGDNCRGAYALPGGKTLLIGSAGPGNDPAQEATFAILDASGHLDTTYGKGVHTFDLGGNDQFWGAAVSGDHVLLVGYKGGGPAAMQTAEKNDDSIYAIFPLIE